MKHRKLTDKDLEPRTKPHEPELIGEVEPTELPKLDTDVSLIDQIDWKNMPKALLNGVFRYFTKFNLFLQAHRPSWIDKIIELLKTLITKLKGSSK
jgi:hypothetical protein